ncbi:MAG TPA: TadE/TadG family type IV pilus assembly protein [Isosphaeraceae bacterium]|nr:TadE/TadG family type IV pilus assembly protein [Isosphaeraceae bacterium]
MIRRKQRLTDRRGTTALECALVSPLVILLLMGMLLMGLGVFRYQQLQSLAREGARYASVHGPQYASENNTSQASTSTVLSYVDGLAVGLGGLDCTAVTYSASSLPCTVSVTLTYTWTPGRLFSPTTWTVTSTMPVTY